MMKTWKLCVIGVMAVSVPGLVGCGQKQATAPPSPQATATTPEAQKAAQQSAAQIAAQVGASRQAGAQRAKAFAAAHAQPQ